MMKNNKTKIITLSNQYSLFDTKHSFTKISTNNTKIFSISRSNKNSSNYKRILALSDHLFRNK